MISARVVRRVVVAVCVLGVAGMIAGSVADSTGLALTAGLVTAAAVVCLMVATAVSRAGRVEGPDEEQARRVEQGIAGLVAAGAVDGDVRALVREAVKLGRRRQKEEEAPR